jgi:heterodisulfide reductase subunit B
MEAVCAALGVTLVELDGWVCCGATAAHALDEAASVELPGHNLRLAEAMGLPVAVPCAACFNRMCVAKRALEDRGEGVSVDVVHPATFLSDPAVTAAFCRARKRTLEGRRLVAYYGCLMVRPPEAVSPDDAENPRTMDRILEATGAEVLDWSYKSECCGGGLALARPDIVAARISEHIEAALDAHADAIVVACPMCHANLDMRQWAGRGLGDMQRVPILYLTEVLGYCLALPDWPRWLCKHLVSCETFLQEPA